MFRNNLGGTDLSTTLRVLKCVGYFLDLDEHFGNVVFKLVCEGLVGPGQFEKVFFVGCKHAQVLEHHTPRRGPDTSFPHDSLFFVCGGLRFELLLCIYGGITFGLFIIFSFFGGDTRGIWIRSIFSRKFELHGTNNL